MTTETPYLLPIGSDRPLFLHNRPLYDRIMNGWAALPATIRDVICEPLGFPEPLRAWGDSNGFGFWTMSRYGAGMSFHVGNPAPRKYPLVVVNMGDETRKFGVSWDHSRPNKSNYHYLRVNFLRAAIDAMNSEGTGPRRREYIHALVQQVNPIAR